MFCSELIDLLAVLLLELRNGCIDPNFTLFGEVVIKGQHFVAVSLVENLQTNKLALKSRHILLRDPNRQRISKVTKRTELGYKVFLNA